MNSMKRVARFVHRVVGGASSFPGYSLPAHTSFPVGQSTLFGFVDSVQVDPSGIIKIVGWNAGEFDLGRIPSVFLDGKPVPFLQHYRYKRLDVKANAGALPTQAGLILEYLVPDSMLSNSKALAIQMQDREWHFETDLTFIDAHYRSLLNTREVLHRDHIYGSGPPNVMVHPEILELAAELSGPLLDFGCGRGALVGVMRQRGVEAYGIELDCEIIRQSMSPELASAITLYDGSFPSPFADGRFRSVMCSEVLEHIRNYESAIRDIARLCTETAIFTVPDASAIPIGFRHGAVPWHLLEGTHVNFFTQQSLENALRPHFSKIEFGRAGASRFNDSTFFTSLVAICWK